jgi:hypothetical protein
VAALEGQYRLLEASSAGTSVQIDNSKLAQAERLIAQIKNKLDTSERVLAYEGKLAEPVQTDPVSEHDVMVQADDYLASAQK